MSTMSLSSMLFANPRASLPYGRVNETKSVSSFMPGLLCPLRTAGSAAKLSRFAKVFDRLMEWKESNCVVKVDDKKVYVLKDGTLEAYAWQASGGTINAFPETSWTSVLAAILLLVTTCDETKMQWTCKNLAAYLNSGVYTNLDAFAICDGFYHEIKTCFGMSISRVTVATQATEVEVDRTANQYAGSNVLINAFQRPPAVYPAAPSSATINFAEILSDCGAGEYTINYEWDKDQQDLIPSRDIFETFMVSPEFVLQLQMMHRILSNPEKASPYNGLMYGTPSAGKSYTIRALAAALGLPLHIVTQKPHTEEDTYEGQVKVKKGKWDFVMTPFLKGFKQGGLIALEEFNLTDAGVLQGALSQALESPYILLEDGITPVQRHPMCVVIGTMNPNVAGAHEMNDAFMSRLRHQIEVKEADKGIIIKQVQGLYPSADKAAIEAVYDEYVKAKECLQLNGGREYEDKLTMRHVYAIVERTLVGFDAMEAARNVLTSAIKLTGDYEMADLLGATLEGIK